MLRAIRKEIIRERRTNTRMIMLTIAAREEKSVDEFELMFLISTRPIVSEILEMIVTKAKVRINFLPTFMFFNIKMFLFLKL